VQGLVLVEFLSGKDVALKTVEFPPLSFESIRPATAAEGVNH
jgi:hypothetical protein